MLPHPKFVKRNRLIPPSPGGHVEDCGFSGEGNGAIGLFLRVHLDGHGVPASQDFNALLATAPATPCHCEALSEEDIAAIVFPGDTTGLPKGAQISHRQIAWNCLSTVIHDLGRGDIYLNVFPMFHVGGLFVYTLPQIILGGTTILMKRFEPERVLQLIEREKVTVFGAVLAMYQLLTQTANWGRST